jgi:membrane-associated protease RseP (regulator of RpoE activity)
MAESVEAIPPFVDAATPSQPRLAFSPTLGQWILHLSLFFATVVTTTFAGIFIVSPEIDVPAPALSTLFDYLLFVPTYYFNLVGAHLAFAVHNPHIMRDGLVFSGPLLAILTSHEMGHYCACRRYGVDATLPFFIPAPPLFLAGTFGAFIKIKSPIPSRRALLDIGLAGPLAGFVVAVPIAIAGVVTLTPAGATPDHAIIFNDPLLFRLIARVAGVQLTDTLINPYYMSAWIGLLVTSLNLMPVGQLDGGHGTFAVFGPNLHKRIGQVAFVSLALISVLGFLWHGSPSGFLFTVLLAIMLRVRHPQPERMEPLGTARVLIAIATLLVFILSFWPFPITIT